MRDFVENFNQFTTGFAKGATIISMFALLDIRHILRNQQKKDR